MTFPVETGAVGLGAFRPKSEGETNADRLYAALTSFTPALSLTMVLLSSMTQA